MRVRIGIKMEASLRWALIAVSVAVFDVVGWVFWRGTWEDGLHDATMLALSLVGFKLFYEIGFATRKLTMTVLRPGRRYRIAGPDGVWVMVGLSTEMDEHGGKAEVQFVDEADYEVRFAHRPRPDVHDQKAQ